MPRPASSDTRLYTLPCHGVVNGQHRASIDGTCDWCGEQVDVPIEEFTSRRNLLTLHCSGCGEQLRCEACG